MESSETTGTRARNPFRCWDARFLLEAAGVAAVIVGVAWFGKTQPRGSAVRIARAVAQSAGFAWIVARSVLALRRLDELQRHIHLVAIAVSFTVIAVLVVGSGFLENAGLSRVEWDVAIWPVMGLVWFVSAAVLARRYR